MKATCRAALVALLAAIGALGCDPSSPTDPVSTGAGGGGGSGTTASKIGGVTVLQQPVGTSWTGVFSAVFYESEGMPAECKTTVDGACTTYDCTYEDSGQNTPVTHQSAGVVSASGTMQPLSLTANADATYTPATSTDQLWAEGATIDLAGDGAAVPPFSGSVVGVAQITLGAPAIGAAALDIDRSKDLVVTWDGGSAGNATVDLTRVEEMGGAMRHSVAVSCKYPPGDKTGTVPTAALQAIPAGPGGSIAFYNRDDDILEISDWRITLSALSSNVAGSATFD